LQLLELKQTVNQILAPFISIFKVPQEKQLEFCTQAANLLKRLNFWFHSSVGIDQLTVFCWIDLVEVKQEDGQFFLPVSNEA